MALIQKTVFNRPSVKITYSLDYGEPEAVAHRLGIAASEPPEQIPGIKSATGRRIAHSDNALTGYIDIYVTARRISDGVDNKIVYHTFKKYGVSPHTPPVGVRICNRYRAIPFKHIIRRHEVCHKLADGNTLESVVLRIFNLGEHKKIPVQMPHASVDIRLLPPIPIRRSEKQSPCYQDTRAHQHKWA